MASHLRTSIVAIAVLVPLVIFVSDGRSQQQLGSGRLDDRPLLRLVLAALLITVLCLSAVINRAARTRRSRGRSSRRPLPSCCWDRPSLTKITSGTRTAIATMLVRRWLAMAPPSLFLVRPCCRHCCDRLAAAPR